MEPRVRFALFAVSIALLSAAALAYQLLLMRLLGISHWYPFAAIIISLALLGHGVSGTVLSLLGERAQRHFPPLYVLCAALFAVTAVVCHVLAQRVPFNGLELVWDLRQLGWLALLYALLMLPFLFAAACFGLAFQRYPQRIGSVYAADLCGAAGGAVGAIVLLYVLRPEHGLWVVAAASLAAAIFGALSLGRAAAALIALPAVIAVLLATLPASLLTPRITEYKGLPRALLVPGARVILERSSPYGLLSVLESPQVPLRHAPGLSLVNTAAPPAQLGVFTDGDALSVINAWDGRPVAHLDWLTSALPYHLRQPQRVLVLGAGGGTEVLHALTAGAAQIHAVDPHPQRAALLREDFASFAGGLYRRPQVQVFVADARAFVRAGDELYDLIVLPLAESFAGSGAGVVAAAEAYRHTVEAFADYYKRLAPDGMLVASGWEKQPPRDTLKLFATAVAALHSQGMNDPQRRLALIRSWDVSTLVMKRGAFTADELGAIRRFCQERAFDIAWLDGVQPDEINRFNRVRHPYLHEGAVALLSPAADRFLADYKFHVAPATDERPHFSHFFKWRALPELLSLRGQGGVVLLDSGYLLLAGALAQALPLALLLILLPLRALKRRSPARPVWRAGMYFMCLGLAFLFIEIAVLQRLTLLLGQPLLAAAAGLAAFLFFAGLGSAVAQRLAPSRRTGIYVVAGIAGAALAYLVLSPLLLSWTGAWPIGWRALLALTAIAPMAALMGLPFPLGLKRLAATAPAFIPWAWGINGCASVLSALLAALLALHWGLSGVILAGIALYGFAAYLWMHQSFVGTQV